MQLTVLGSTGSTGERIVDKALHAGHSVTAVARRQATDAGVRQNLRLTIGDVADPGFLEDAIRGSEAILSALGSRDMKHPTSIYSSSAAAAISAMQATGVRRFLAISAIPVTPATEKLPLNRYVLDPLLYQFFGGGYDDMRRMEEILCASDVEWTVFRPPYLRGARGRGTWRSAVGGPLSGAFALTRDDLADAMLAAIPDTATFRRIVTIAN